MNQLNASLLYSVLTVTAIVGSFFSPYLSVANGQSPIGMMNGNKTDIGQSMSMPQNNLGVVTMPVTCTSLGEILRSVTGMTGGDANESQKNIMDMMQKMMSGGVLAGPQGGAPPVGGGQQQPQQSAGPQGGAPPVRGGFPAFQPDPSVGGGQQQPQQLVSLAGPQGGAPPVRGGQQQPQQLAGPQGGAPPVGGGQQLQQGIQELKQLNLQGIMNMQLCSLMTDQTMMEEMLTDGGNATKGSMPPPPDSSAGIPAPPPATMAP
jgi:hypothetical protein